MNLKGLFFKKKQKNYLFILYCVVKFKKNTMKKIYLSALALSFGLLSFGQNVGAKKFQNDTEEKARLSTNLDRAFNSSSNVVSYKKAPGDTIWKEDFSRNLCKSGQKLAFKSAAAPKVWLSKLSFPCSLRLETRTFAPIKHL